MNTFKKIMSVISEYRIQLKNNIPNKSLVDKYVQMFSKLNTQFATQVAKIEPFELKIFIDNNDIELYRVHDTLRGSFAKLVLPLSLVLAWRAQHDVFFTSIGMKRPSTRFSHVATKIFNEFVKGITYFESNTLVANPVYHRDESCGVAGVPANAKFVVDLLDTQLVQERKKKITKMCYLERLVYNDIYKNVFNFQDSGHLYELHMMEKLFEKYNPTVNSFYIHIKYSEDSMYPVYLAITIKRSFHTESEEYVKLWKSNIIQCSKTVNDLFFDKVQTFQKEEPWMMKT